VPTCTSYEQINANTVQGAITLKGACGCSVTITGGTETGHASGTYSHWNGYKLDFAKASGLNSYITNTFTRIANRGDGYPQWQAASGNIYCVSFQLRFGSDLCGHRVGFADMIHFDVGRG
jgi:hypothetical protein